MIVSSIVAAMLFPALFPAVIFYSPVFAVRRAFAIATFPHLMVLFDAGRRPRPSDLVGMEVRSTIEPGPVPLGVIDDH